MYYSLSFGIICSLNVLISSLAACLAVLISSGISTPVSAYLTHTNRLSLNKILIHLFSAR